MIARGIWRVADPKITLASAASLLLGSVAAAKDGPLDPMLLFLTVAGIFFLEAAKNASGEIFDFDSGTDTSVSEEDRSPFSGGKRVLVDRLMTRGQTAVAAAVFYLLGSAIGLSIVIFYEPSALWLGIAGVALAFFYHAPPIALSYRGWGELAVALSYGPLIACGAYLVQRHHISTEVLLLSMPLGLLIGAFLVINEFPDCAADASAGKRTLVVRLGKAGASRAYAAIAVTAYLLVALIALTASTPWALLGLCAAPLSIAAARRLLRHHRVTREIIPAQAWTLLAFLSLSVGLSVALGLG